MHGATIGVFGHTTTGAASPVRVPGGGSTRRNTINPA
jgi:hypothetical protein